MASAEHIRILKSGVGTWNQWRKANPKTKPNLKGVRLIGPNLCGYNISDPELKKPDITPAELENVNFSHTDLSDGVLIGAELEGADFTGANLERADLYSAILFGAKFHDTNLKGASLVGASLSHAHFRAADLTGTRLSGALIGWSTFSNTDLSVAAGLEHVEHEGPSTIGLDTNSRSKGCVPKAFLRGCGLADWEIEAGKLNDPKLSNQEIRGLLDSIQSLRADRPLQVNRLFISYSHLDSPFVDKMEQELNNAGIRFWRDDHHATAGRLEKQVDKAIHDNPIFLLVLSNNSVKSDWVQHEVRLARELELESGRDVLCPIALDQSWKTCKWPERLKEQVVEYHILDFSNWKSQSSFQRMFSKLTDGLVLFYR
ncbi:MAG: toll/interleukin-1 receptor domain-containing protein [Acidobacteriota bacterium]